MLCNIKPVPFHESDKHIFAEIPGGWGGGGGGGGLFRTPPSPPLYPPMKSKPFTSQLFTKQQILRLVRIKREQLQTTNEIWMKKLKFVLGRVENIVGKGENAGYQYFLLFPRCF